MVGKIGTHRVAIADFRRTSYSDGKISPRWWGWGVHAHPFQPITITYVQCMLLLRGQINSLYFVSTPIFSLWLNNEHARKRKYSKVCRSPPMRYLGTHLIKEESLGLLGCELEGDAGVPARGEPYKVHQVKHGQCCVQGVRDRVPFWPPGFGFGSRNWDRRKSPDQRFGIRDKHNGSCFREHSFIIMKWLVQKASTHIWAKFFVNSVLRIRNSVPFWPWIRDRWIRIRDPE